MLGLIIREPWISKIFRGEKTWELRTRNTKIRGRIALIRGGSGLVIGTVILKDVLKSSPGIMSLRVNRQMHRVPSGELMKECADRDTVYAWVLAVPKRYKKPRRYKHPNGAVIWVRLPERFAA